MDRFLCSSKTFIPKMKDCRAKNFAVIHKAEVIIDSGLRGLGLNTAIIALFPF